MRMWMVLLAAAAIAVVAWLVVGGPFGKDPVTKAQIETAVGKKPKHGHVQVVLCNEEFVPSQKPQSNPPQRWTCDTYIGPTKADAQNGPSYRVLVSDDEIRSIRQVPTH